MPDVTCGAVKAIAGLAIAAGVARPDAVQSHPLWTGGRARPHDVVGDSHGDVPAQSRLHPSDPVPHRPTSGYSHESADRAANATALDLRPMVNP